MSAFVPRTLSSTISLEGDGFPYILIDGMPGVGKTSLAGALFKDLTRLDMTEIQSRTLAANDPAAFFRVFGKRLLIDNIERCPSIAENLPPPEADTKIVMVGNLPADIKEKIKASVGLKVYHLTPFSQREMAGQTCEPFGMKPIPIRISYPQGLFFEAIRNGFLPRENIAQTTRAFYETWLSNFFQETVEGVMKVAKVDRFLHFMQVLAQNNMREINHSKMSVECRISYATAIYWTQFLLDAGVLLEVPSLKLAQRRQVKRGKIIFADTGLLCHMINIASADELIASPHYPQIFSGFVASELIKNYHAWGEEAPVCFYRDTAKKHVELLVRTKTALLPIGFLSHGARAFEEQIRHMDVLRRMNERCLDNVFITDGTEVRESTSYALIAATDL